MPKITPAAAGPYTVEGNRIMDANGHEYLIRGTSLPPVTLNADSDPLSVNTFGAFSGTTLITIRQRLNMNAVRLRVQAQGYEANGAYRERVKEIVQRANRFELLAIIESDPSTSPSTDTLVSFWVHCAAEFKTNPNVFFDVSSVPVSSADVAKRAVDGIRSAGAVQPVIVGSGSGFLQEEPNIIYEVFPSYASKQNIETQLGSMPARVALLVNGLDPQLHRTGPECAAFPSDPGVAAKLMNDLLNYFDEHSVSWTISSLDRGKLVDNFRGYNWTKLDDGWICGESSARAGIAMTLLSHLWSADPHGVFNVNQPAGGLVIARGANSSAYGRILAPREARADRFPLPWKLGGISVSVKDSRGVARFAPLSWTGAGWSHLNLVIPANSATGPAEVTVIRADGSRSASTIIIADVAPGLWTATNDGRGPAIGQVSQRFSDGKTAQFPAWTCAKGDCRTVPIPLTPNASTKVRIEGTGFRFASSKAALRVVIDGITVPVVDFGPMRESSLDQVTVKLPDKLIGRGEADVFLIADGALSNVVRINCGGGDFVKR